MKTLLILAFGIISVSAKTSRPNVLLICVDDLRPELKCFGAEYIHSPNIDKLAESGRIFTRHFVQAPTCGASRYALLTGNYAQSDRGNGALFSRAKKLADPPASPSLPRHFRDHGYTTVSVGKVSHHPGGRGGSDWDSDDQIEMPKAWTRHLQPTGPWQHPRGIMHGLANGEIRKKSGDMAVYQAEDGPDEIYPDGLTTNTALEELGKLTKDEKPFFLAVGIIRPHLPFGAPKKYLDLYKNTQFPPIPHAAKPEGQTTWHGSGEFMKYNRWGKNPNKDEEFATEIRRHYAACVSYADAQVGRLLKALDDAGQSDNTIVVFWGDHGWHLGEHGIWGKHALFEESLHSPLIIHHPGMKHPGQSTEAIVETIDIFPTLCGLADIPTPKTLNGTPLTKQLNDPKAKGDTAVSYSGRAETIRTDTHRLIAHKSGFNELYDHRQPDAETRNIAKDHPEVTSKLKKQLKARLAK